MSAHEAHKVSKSLKYISVLAATTVGVALSFAPVSATSVVKRAPSAPVLQSLIAGDKLFTITVSAPTDPGTAAVSQYGYSLNDGAWLTLGAASSAGTAKIVKVAANDVDYIVKVRAKNSAGWGAVLDAGTVRPVQPSPVYPDAPTIVSAYDSACHNLRVEIVAPVVTLGKITRYSYQLGDGYKWNNGIVKDGVSNIHTSIARPFTFRIKAFNSAKYSGWGSVAEKVVEKTVTAGCLYAK